MKNIRVETAWVNKKDLMENPKLSKYIADELSVICFEYTEKTGLKMPPESIDAMTVLLLNAYNNLEVRNPNED
jgi:gamma-glutamyltranspeptidase